MFLGNIDWHYFALMILALVICVTIHEFAHALSAVRSGDDTPRLQGRISINPIDHLDPIGTFMMVVSSLSGFGIGWGKAVQVNPLNFRRPRWDNLMVSLWGPLSNLVTALVLGTVLRFGGHWMGANVEGFIELIVIISIGLAIFNLIPIAPLDGSHILSSLLPVEQARKYDMMMARYGMLIFMGLIFIVPMMFNVNILGMILGPPRMLLWRLFTGMPW